MSNEILDQLYSGKPKIFKDSHFYGAIFLGGPLVGGYMMAENYKAFGEPEKARTTWIITLLSTIAIFAFSFFLNSRVHSPNMAIPLIYTGLGAMLMRRYQGDKIVSYLADGGAAYDWKRTLLISIIGLVLTMMALFMVSFYFGIASQD